MKLKTFTAGILGVNMYLLIDENTNDAIMIDCPETNDEFLKYLEDNKIHLKTVLLTHGHFDHVLGINRMREFHPDVKFYMHKNDEDVLQMINAHLAQFGMGKVEPPTIDGFVEEGQIIKFGNSEIKVILTNGHTKGGVCYLVDDKLFCGDTIFLGSVGRCDLFGGDFDALVKNIKTKIFTLDENITIYPGHGPKTTVGHEKKYNQFN